MLELVNLSNIPHEVENLLGGEKAALEDFLARHHLDGLELFLYGPRDESFFPAALVHGVHLRRGSASGGRTRRKWHGITVMTRL